MTVRTGRITTHGSRLTLFALIALGAISAAVAQDFPSRPVRMVIPIGPGSSMDITGRVVAQKMNEGWNQPVVVDNRPGAGGNIGADVVAKETADGGAGSARLGAWMRPGSGL